MTKLKLLKLLHKTLACIAVASLFFVIVAAKRNITYARFAGKHHRMRKRSRIVKRHTETSMTMSPCFAHTTKGTYPDTIDLIWPDGVIATYRIK